MSLLDWAKNEIEIACKRERGLELQHFGHLLEF